MADTSNDGTLIESFNSANVPLLKSVLESEYQTTVGKNLESNNRQDWVAEPDSEQQAQINSEFQQLLALNQELSRANTDLYSQVEQLKTELAEADKILQWQKTRSSVTESMLNQQTQELSAAQEQIQSLFKQLETAVQTVQHQEIFVETHKSQLQISQQRLAQLERECSLLQTNYSEQSHHLLQSENTCRELRTRLMRQQRQTLQFKAALEKCLDQPVPSYDTLEDVDYINSEHSRFSQKERWSQPSVFTNAQPIKPWSADSGFVSDSINHSIKVPVNPPPYTKKYPTPEVVESDTVVSSESVELEQQLDSLIQKFFVPQPVSSTTENQVVDLDIPTLTVENDQQPEQELEVEDSVPDVQISLPVPEYKKLNTVEIEDYWAEVPLPKQSQLPVDDISAEVTGEYPSDYNSPSPLIYPQRPPKGRKSLASVELPNFHTRKHK
ncbi:hypothetical protein [Cronbergia sp. UHCC 0137]|uniref:hypothetical protein n=1 Tax=Cronbergia sp. UHCC 0137 TaxID=3110239 RepID=UPI003A4C5C05